jgi:DNA-binding transcriptional LysR family regulator
MDLSLTRVLCAVYDAGGVSRVAEALYLTQPAVSHALARLRQEVADPLFVRTASGMRPTPLADQLYLRYREALQLHL